MMNTLVMEPNHTSEYKDFLGGMFHPLVDKNISRLNTIADNCQNNVILRTNKFHEDKNNTYGDYHDSEHIERFNHSEIGQYSSKIQDAIPLLTDRKLTISEVAYKVGFNNPGYFSRCFIQEVGISPKLYRETKFSRICKNNELRSNRIFLMKAVQKVYEHINDSHYLFDDFASDLFLSKTTLYRKLKKISGVSPCMFINKVKLHYSKQLLLRESAPVADIAFMAGYADPKYFSKCFRKEFGLTPSNYVKENSLNSGKKKL